MSVVLIALVSIIAFNLVTYPFKSTELPNNVPSAIQDKVDMLKELKEEQLNNALSILIKIADNGIPKIIDSTDKRTIRYMEEANYTLTLALEHASERINTPLKKVVQIAITNIPYVGIPYSLVIPYWQKVRYLLLVAKLNNHSTTDTIVTDGVKDCLINSAFYSIGHKAEEKLVGKAFSFLDKFLTKVGFKYFHNMMSLPVQSLLVFLENDKAIIECGRVKFG